MTNEANDVSTTDALLLEGLRRRDDVSFEAVFLRYYPRVRNMLRRLLGDGGQAEELAQDVFLKLYREPLPAGREHNLIAWLYRVATNLGYNALRAQRRSQTRETLWQARESTGFANPEAEVIRADVQDRVRRALSRLSTQQAQILMLRHDGMSYREIADVVQVAPGSVGTLLARAEQAFERHYLDIESHEGGDNAASD
jgi:RNA polymerase sigma-70 factor, ECF subfamily